MPRRFLSLLTVLAFAAAVVLAIARPGALSRDGTFAQPAAAVPDTQPSATPWAYIDKVWNGDGWCDPNHIDTTTTEYVGDSHQLAICIDNLPGAVHSFTAAISYDGALDQCIDKPCIIVDSLRAQRTEETCLDDNPDANAGVTTWPHDVQGLGLGWTCSELTGSQYQAQYLLNSEPICTLPLQAMPVSSEKTAWIHCEGTEGYQFDQLGKDGGWGALAVLTLNVIGAGTDNVSIRDLEVSGGEYTLTCPFTAAPNGNSLTTFPTMPCQGATDIKQPPERHRRPTSTPIPAPTSTPTVVVPTVPPPPPPATPTPSGGAGPAIVAPTTGSGPTDSDAPWALWLAAGLAGAALAAGGFYLRYVRSDR
jgi:hypothetical protein